MTTISGQHIIRVAAAIAEKVVERFHSLPFEDQEIGGLFADRMKVNVEGRLRNIDVETFLSGFRDRNAQNETGWVGEHAGKFLEAACNSVRYRDDPILRERIATIANALIASQEPDGYLGTYPEEKRWTGWDVWTHKYNIVGLMSYYKLTGADEALACCRKMGDLLVGTFGDRPDQRDIISAGEHIGMAATSVLEPMCALYRHTGDERHLDFCHYIVRAYDHHNGPRIVSALLDHGDVLLTANAKAYEMLSNFNGLVDFYRITGEKNLLAAVLRGWEDIVAHQLYPTGTASAFECFQPHARLLTMQSSHMGEMCVTVTWLQLNWRLLRLTGEARFGHEIERTVYNHLFAAQNAATGDISYYTAFVGPKKHTSAVLCCVSSGPRGIAMLPQVMWGIEKDAFVVNLYAPGRARFEIAGAPASIVSKTDFPSSGEVSLTLTLERPASFTLRLRVPEWATRFEVAGAGDTLAGTPGAFLDISRRWEGVTVLRVSMDMPVQILTGGSLYPDYLALKRGAQVLALDKAINPAIPYLTRVALADDADPIVATPITPPTGWVGHQVYEVATINALPEGQERLRAAPGSARLVPYADALATQVWLLRPDRLTTDIPAVTAFAEAAASTLNFYVESKARSFNPTDITEYLTDERRDSFCTVDPTGTTLAVLMGAPHAPRGSPVWIAVALDTPAVVTRLVMRQGAMSSFGGWFDTANGKPVFEITTAPVPMFFDFVQNFEAATWETAGVIANYPDTDGAAPPAIAPGQSFEIRLAKPTLIYAVRIVGRPGGDYASCARLGAFA